jgi:hypothetical protein
MASEVMMNPSPSESMNGLHTPGMEDLPESDPE